MGTVKLHEGLLTALVLHIPPSVDDVVALVHCVVIQTPGLAVHGRSETVVILSLNFCEAQGKGRAKG